MSEPPLVVETFGQTVRLTLNRPDKRNAFTAELHQAFRAALDELETRGDVRCLVLTGAGKAFCAGQDLNERVRPAGVPPVDIGEQLERDLIPLIRRLRQTPFAVIAAVNGVAAGAGFSLALAADIVIAARAAQFVASFAKVGLGPDGGLSWMLPRLVGSARAAGMMMLGEPLSATDAEQWGLIWRCVDDPLLEAEAFDIAGRLAALPRRAVLAVKASLRQGLDNDFDGQLQVERGSQRDLGFGADYREAISAFIEKRRPSFRE